MYIQTDSHETSTKTFPFRFCDRPMLTKSSLPCLCSLPFPVLDPDADAVAVAVANTDANFNAALDFSFANQCSRFFGLLQCQIGGIYGPPY